MKCLWYNALARNNMVDRAIVIKRLLLVLFVVIQITMAPIVLFSLTYLIDINYDTASVGIRTDLIHWVVIAGLYYGMVSIGLALVLGGFRPFFVSNQGGVLAFLRLSRDVAILNWSTGLGLLAKYPVWEDGKIGPNKDK